MALDFLFYLKQFSPLAISFFQSFSVFLAFSLCYYSYIRFEKVRCLTQMNLLIVMCLFWGNAFMLCALDPNLYQWQNWWFDIYQYYVLYKINDNIIHMNILLEQIYSTLCTILARFIKNIFFVLTFCFVVVYEVDFILKEAKRIIKKIWCYYKCRKEELRS